MYHEAAGRRSLSLRCCGTFRPFGGGRERGALHAPCCRSSRRARPCRAAPLPLSYPSPCSCDRRLTRRLSRCSSCDLVATIDFLGWLRSPSAAVVVERQRCAAAALPFEPAHTAKPCRAGLVATGFPTQLPCCEVGARRATESRRPSFILGGAPPCAAGLRGTARAAERVERGFPCRAAARVGVRGQAAPCRSTSAAAPPLCCELRAASRCSSCDRVATTESHLGRRSVRRRVARHRPCR